MISEIDLLKKDIPRLERKFGVDNPFVEVLKAQLASLLNQTEQQAKREQFNSNRFLFFDRTTPS